MRNWIIGVIVVLVVAAVAYYVLRPGEMPMSETQAPAATEQPTEPAPATEQPAEPAPATEQPAEPAPTTE